jgi:hypothetical protein
MRRLFLSLLFSACAWAQSITITAPTANQAISGFQGFAFTVSVSSLPALAAVCYTVDAYPALGSPVLTAGDVACSYTSPWSLPFNTYKNLNGPHQVVATGYDFLGNTLATSAAVAFSTANTWPITCNPVMTIGTSTGLGSNWSGAVTITPAITGSCSGDNIGFTFWIDGITQSTLNGPLAPDTTQFPNGPHVLMVTSTDDTNRTCYVGGCQNLSTEWSRVVTFANAAAPMEVRADAREVFLQAGQTHQIVATVVNTDGTTSTPGTVYYFSANTSICTVNSTGLVTAVANGACLVYLMAPQITGTDLQITGSGSGPAYVVAQSNAHPFPYTTGGTGQSVGLIQITAGSGWTPGTYTIKNWNYNGGSTPSLTVNGSPAGNGATNGSFAVGFTRAIWFKVWPDNIMPHFANDGSGVLTTYTPGKSKFMSSSFSSEPALLNDITYSPGQIADRAASGYNVIETSIDAAGIYGTSQSTFQSLQAAYVAQMQALVAGTNLRFSLVGDNFLNGLDTFWAYTEGPMASWSPTALHTLFGSWTGQTNPPIWAPMKDEVNSTYGASPLQGPLIFSAGVQSGLTSIVASGGTCTASLAGWSFTAVNRFVIRNATTSGFNSATGSTYTGSKVDNNTFTFACSVANGTYNSGTDASLAIEPLGIAWYNGNTDYLHYNAFAQLRTQAASAGFVPMSWPNAALTNLKALANFSGNSVQSIGGVTQVGDVNDLYVSGTAEYTASRYSTNALIKIVGDGQIRGEYGSYNPDLPTVIQTNGVVGYYGFQGYPVAVSSCSGNTITFSSPHGLTTVLNGITRLWVTGNAGCNGNYYVLSIPDTTHLKVALATSTFAGTGTGGTLTFSNDSYTKTIGSITTFSGPDGTCSGSGVPGGVMCGEEFSYTGGADANVNAHAGQQFTISGNSLGSFNSNTFVLVPETITVPAVGQNYFRQIPSLSGSCGTATIVADNFYVKGRNGGTQGDVQPGWGFSTVDEAIDLGAIGTRLYKDTPSFAAYASNFGFGGQWGLNYIFQDTGMSVQLFSNPHWENFNSVPNWWATSNLNKLMQATNVAALYFQPRLNSPDYGPHFEASAHGGSNGNILRVSNFTDAPQTLTINLAPYLKSGQAIIKEYLNPLGVWTVTTLTAGTSSDTVPFDANGSMTYLFPATFAGSLNPPVVLQNLASFPGATHIGVQYGYNTYLLKTSAVQDCGSGATCTLNADLNAGTVYYQQVGLDASNVVKGTSAVLSVSQNTVSPVVAPGNLLATVTTVTKGN